MINLMKDFAVWKIYECLYNTYIHVHMYIIYLYILIHIYINTMCECAKALAHSSSTFANSFSRSLSFILFRACAHVNFRNVEHANRSTLIHPSVLLILSVFRSSHRTHFFLTHSSTFVFVSFRCHRKSHRHHRMLD